MNGGERLNLLHFGPATALRLCTLDNKELACDVKADTGESMYLSMAYVERLMFSPGTLESAIVTRGPM